MLPEAAVALEAPDEPVFVASAYALIVSNWLSDNNSNI